MTAEGCADTGNHSTVVAIDGPVVASIATKNSKKITMSSVLIVQPMSSCRYDANKKFADVGRLLNYALAPRIGSVKREAAGRFTLSVRIVVRRAP